MPPGIRGSLVWGDGIFANQAQLKAWLKLHGGSYEVWVRQHPAALRLVKPRTKHELAVARQKAAAARRAAAHKTSAPASVPVVPAVATTGTATSSSSQGLVIWLAVIGGLLLGGLAALPNGVVRRIGLVATVGEREMRVGALGAGAAILLGVIVATLAS